ncbi:hypothetical protein [Massilia brevitalea]|uniref:hypothetical protein n=1 Tax=Massilia brevitalea TaxID=442526 RepID=UPI0027396F7B|nr:hypothetical protein [Massilia brevitalea]
MQEFYILGGAILAIIIIAAVITFSLNKGDSSRTNELSSVPDELELRRRDNETMLRHERRAAHERHFQNLEAQKALTSEK